MEQAFALHITSDRAVRRGHVPAGTDDGERRRVHRDGSPARAATARCPHHAVDPVPAAAAMVGALQTMVTRRFSVFDPAVLTVGRITAGTTSNIIPETAELQGTIRTLSDRARKPWCEEIPKVCEHIGAAHGCRLQVDIDTGYPVDASTTPTSRRGCSTWPSAVLGQRNSALMPDPLMARGGLLVRPAAGAGRARVPRRLPAGRRPGRGRAEPLEPGALRRVRVRARGGDVRGVRAGRPALNGEIRRCHRRGECVPCDLCV